MDDNDNIFNGWMQTGTVRRIEVPMYGNMPLVAEAAALQAEIDEAEKAASGTRTINQRSPIPALEAELDALYERLAESRSVWTVRALKTAEAREIAEKFPNPVSPKTIDAKATDAEAERYEARLQKFRHDYEVAETERNLRFVHHAVVEIKTANGSQSGISLEDLRSMFEAEYGRQRLTLLLEAVNKATTGDVAIERPTSPGESGSDRA